jgi:hypothetical protein
MVSPWSLRLSRVLGMLAVVCAITWPLVLDPSSVLLGFPSIDSQDTVMLRGLIADLLLHPWDWPESGLVYWPQGYPVGLLTPNLLDHVTAAPFVWLLPFPWADNLWWVAVLLLNGLCAHRLGRAVGGSEGAGWLAAIALLTSEPVLRETNLHHAPQAMVLWGPLYLDALLRLRTSGRLRTAALAGLWLALADQSYWYYGLFLGAGSLPLLVGLRPRAILTLGGVAAAASAPVLLPQLLAWDARPLTSGAIVPPPVTAHASFASIPQEQVFSAMHGNDLLWWWRSTPIDTANRVSLALLLAAGLGFHAWGRAPDRRARWGLAFMAVLGGVMVLGPWLREGEALWIQGGHAVRLPFQWMRDLHPFLARLTWPERWGWIVPLALAGLAARSRWPGVFAALVLIENMALSANTPVQVTDVRHQECWAQVAHAPGALVVLPLRRGGLRASEVGVQQRRHGRPVANPVMLPPGARPPQDWHAWKESDPLMQYLMAFEAGEHPGDPGADAVRGLRDAGVSAIVVDAEPGRMLTPGGVNRYEAGIGRHLGRPLDLGCALVWWLDADAPPPTPVPDGDAWRDAAQDWKESHPVPELESLIGPTWDRLQASGD